ncbi:hypothetical protein M0812_12355 [Anaeramoeba flamelloides]|uniref:Uncharacterized protein n=1 Tax=Anaeramoeba flamelloides TaxID=1746091 RepID=A0AAV7ZP91_9EUKA|nr:hypothetical protein M0812_12355 [Anaeramoeba flamelloides]|eukprot:Anaeramoba_flamelloidesa808190_1071.p1 GENE.a808190_1071~~a808190_1071.p1  ORF type:complete len:218 (-),score=31.53 a808190_1071:142-795(-)
MKLVLITLSIIFFSFISSTEIPKEDSIYMTHGRYYGGVRDCSGDRYLDFTRIDNKCYPAYKNSIVWNVTDPADPKSFSYYMCEGSGCDPKKCSLFGTYKHDTCVISQADPSSSYYYTHEKYDRKSVNVISYYQYNQNSDCTSDDVSINTLVQGECYNLDGNYIRVVFASDKLQKIYLEQGASSNKCSDPNDNHTYVLGQCYQDDFNDGYKFVLEAHV